MKNIIFLFTGSPTKGATSCTAWKCRYFSFFWYLVPWPINILFLKILVLELFACTFLQDKVAFSKAKISTICKSNIQLCRRCYSILILISWKVYQKGLVHIRSAKLWVTTCYLPVPMLTSVEVNDTNWRQNDTYDFHIEAVAPPLIQTPCCEMVDFLAKINNAYSCFKKCKNINLLKVCHSHMGHLLLTWFNFNSVMGK